MALQTLHILLSAMPYVPCRYLKKIIFPGFEMEGGSRVMIEATSKRMDMICLAI